MSNYLYLLSILFVTSCASNLSPKIVDSDIRQITDCTFIATVSGTSGWGNLMASVGIENAKQEARDKAFQLGATNIIWV
ncbi:hypothetical protein L2734_08220 [Parashewanella spongiae]|uniref:hypothetical protein n=1 Tax=Parashewanella spongiae TaxID=342950 RepID=UPI000EF8B87A|nr:hypothetical protein [Parashewanella spongiae]MCL1078162.1 hypothetical protein [Parashewanella spongiae]